MRWVSGAPTRAARRTFRGENVHVWKGGGSVKRREEKWGKGRKGRRKDRETRKKNEWRWIAVLSLFSFFLLLFFLFIIFLIFVYFLSFILFSFLGNKCREKINILVIIIRVMRCMNHVVLITILDISFSLFIRLFCDVIYASKYPVVDINSNHCILFFYTFMKGDIEYTT